MVDPSNVLSQASFNQAMVRLLLQILFQILFFPDYLVQKTVSYALEWVWIFKGLANDAYDRYRNPLTKKEQLGLV